MVLEKDLKRPTPRLWDEKGRRSGAWVLSIPKGCWMLLEKIKQSSDY